MLYIRCITKMHDTFLKLSIGEMSIIYTSAPRNILSFSEIKRAFDEDELCIDTSSESGTELTRVLGVNILLYYVPDRPYRT